VVDLLEVPTILAGLRVQRDDGGREDDEVVARLPGTIEVR
jgi:hypothetical protein